MALLTIVTDGTQRNTLVMDAVLNNLVVPKLHVREFVFEDGTKGIAFEVEVEDEPKSA